MRQIFFITTAISFLLTSCQNEPKRDFNKEKERIFSDIYNDSQISSEFFEINSISDTTLKTKNGTTIKIYANSFLNTDSTSFSGNYTLEIKEAYKPVDFVLGNLMTINNYQTYKRRQAIVEHPYGIIKRQWGFYYIMTKKGKKRASADVGLIFTAFNLRRILNILDQNLLKKFLKELAFLFLQKPPYTNLKLTYISPLNFHNIQPINLKSAA